MANDATTHGRPLKDFGKPPTFEWIYTDHLVIDESYQRAIDGQRSQALIARIGREFKWKKFGAVLATPNGDGRYNIIDGQHRIEGAKLAGITKVPCIVVESLTQAEQADAFLGANDRLNITPTALFHARVRLGKPEEVRIQQVCERAGVRIPRSPQVSRHMQPNDTTAISSVGNMIWLYGEDVTVAALKGVMFLFRTRGCLRKHFIVGLARFMVKHPTVTMETIAAKLAGRSIDSIEMQIKVLATENAIGRHFAFERMLSLLTNKSTTPPRPVRRPTVDLQAMADGR